MQLGVALAPGMIHEQACASELLPRILDGYLRKGFAGVIFLAPLLDQFVNGCSGAPGPEQYHGICYSSCVGLKRMEIFLDQKVE